MIIHIGWEVCVESGTLVAILNKSSSRAARNATDTLISAAKRAGRFTPCPDEERAYVITMEDGKEHVYASAINAATLLRRIQSAGLQE